MNRCTILMAGLVLCCSILSAIAESNPTLNVAEPSTLAAAQIGESPNEEHVRPKRTLFLKKKLLGAGLLGFGLGVAKGYKVGHYHGGPEVHHVYSAPPPPAIRYVEYVEKPVYIDRIVERPVFKEHHHHAAEYEQSWSPQAEPSSAYGSSW